MQIVKGRHGHAFIPTSAAFTLPSTCHRGRSLTHTAKKYAFEIRLNTLLVRSEPNSGGKIVSNFLQADKLAAATPSAWPSQPAFFLATVSAFVGVTSDLFAPFSPRFFLQNIDQPTHNWVVTHVPSIIRDLIFEIGVSNIAIVLGGVGWAICTSVLLNDVADSFQGSNNVQKVDEAFSEEEVKADSGSNSKTLIRLASIWGLYGAAGGFIVPGDNVLVHWLKITFNRARPSTRHKSFSFPSGHTTAVTFIIGILLFALLPWLLETLEVQSTPSNKSSQLGIFKSEAMQSLAQSLVKSGSTLWLLSIFLTAAGRIVGDVHWVSDTGAGALLGASLVSGFLMACNRAESKQK